MSFLKDERGKYYTRTYIIGGLIIVLILGAIFLIPTFLKNGKEENTQDDSLSINSNIPKDNKDVDIEKDEEIKYIEQKELEQILKNNLNNQIADIKDELDRNIKDFVDNIRKEREKEIKKLETELKKIKTNTENNSNEKLEKLSKQIERLKEENKTLRNKLTNLENKIKNISNRDYTRPINDIPKNDYVINNEKESEEEKEDETKVTKITKPSFYYSGIIQGEENIAILKFNDSDSQFTKEINTYFRGYKILEIKPSYIKVEKQNKEFILNMQ